MMKATSNIRAWMRAQWVKSKKRREENIRARIAEAAADDLQIRKYDGGVYVSYRGIPLKKENTAAEAVVTLEQMRKNYANYFMRRQQCVTHERKPGL